VNHIFEKRNIKEGTWFIALKINSNKMIAPPRKNLSEAQAVEINQEFLDIYKNCKSHTLSIVIKMGML